MTSQINPADIDGTYPIAGQDNDSQGFRDNFTNTQNNFTHAENELSDLQGKVVLKSALSGDTLDNDFADALVKGARISDFSEVVTDKGSVAGPVEFNHLDGHFQTVDTTGALTLAFDNWPVSGNLGRIRVQITVSNVAHTVTLPAEVTIGNNEVSGLDTLVLTFSKTGTFIFEFTTADNGTTIAISDLSRSSSNIEFPSGTPATAVGVSGDYAGQTSMDSNYLYICTGNYDGATAIWIRIGIAATW